MAVFRSVIKPSMINGVRTYDPAFKPRIKELTKSKYILLNDTTNRIYKELLETLDKPPRMHSFFVPKWKQVKQWQIEASLDTGQPLHMRWPISRTVYRSLWFLLLAQLIISDYKMFLVIRDVNFGMKPPDFIFYFP